MEITLVEAIKLFYQKYTDFASRATRAEYWWVVLYLFVASGILSWINDWLGYAFGLINLVPNIAIAIRRMHDIGKSGWWILIGLIPIVGWIWYLILTIKPSDGPNEYGE